LDVSRLNAEVLLVLPSCPDAPFGSLLLNIVTSHTAPVAVGLAYGGDVAFAHGIDICGKTVDTLRNGFDIVGGSGARNKCFPKAKYVNSEISFFNHGVRPDHVQKVIL